MFIDQEWKKNKDAADFKNAKPLSANVYQNSNKKWIIAGLVILILAVFGITAFLYLKTNNNSLPTGKATKIDKNKTNGSTTEPVSGLPDDLSNGNQDDLLAGLGIDNLKAENISFGYFYKKPESNFKPNFKNYSLPINIKVDAANYYDISRKLNLDPYLDYINNNGYAIFPAGSIGAEKNKNSDFFSTYRYLLSKQIPVMVTNDFLIYYYQNNLKKVYKEIEKNIFYENVWDIANKLYTVALTRYKKRLSDVGEINDPVLEGERVELAFFAVTLKLLSPTEEQINRNTELVDGNKFTVEEAGLYDFIVPEYLKEDVLREVDYIRQAKNKIKSPVMLYSVDYGSYKVPDNYKSNVKLNNFYLAMKWMNSLFPLYYENDNCPDCFLDYNDWTVNLAAASFIAKDISDNQELKNRWAIIYKFIAFFSGLRQELTYLHYDSALKKIFGQDYELEKILAANNKNRENDLSKLQSELESINFVPLEGMLNREDEANKSKIGMRMLQEPYWPNNYIFSKLSGNNLKSPEKPANLKDVKTACAGEKNQYAYRCSGFSLDIINLVNQIDNGGKYFLENTNYLNYDTQIESLRSEIAKFDNYSWNNNIYWLSLDLARKIISKTKDKLPVYMNSDNWQAEKDINTSLGTWANLHLAEDIYSNYYEQKASYLGESASCNEYNFIEPDIEFINELIARNEMLIKMLTLLKVAEKTNAVAIELKELEQKLEKVLIIAQKELSNEKLNSDDCIFIKDLVSHYVVDNNINKSFVLEFKGKKLEESINGMKLTAVVNQFSDRKMIVVGPVFNFLEK